MAKTQFDRHSLILEGQHRVIRSGAMHYFRLPHPSLWWDRLKKLKSAGYNTVDLYFNWDFHSPEPGVYDFTGVRDVAKLLDMVEQLGLYLIGRPGPYINAETTRGGLPGWLLSQPEVILRNRVDGVYHYSPAYMAFVKEWFDQVLPFLRPRENLLMIQVENEYSTLDMEPDYMNELSAIIRANGIDAPSMHNDFYAAGLYAGEVDIYAVDNYSVTLFDLNWRTFPDVFSVVDHLEEQLRPEICATRPLMMAELQAGWFAGWKGVPYETIHQSLGREHIGIVTRSFLGQGGTIFNHYKAIGGTNWDHLGATDAYTSYDFSAPISEAGLPTERLYEAKAINLLLEHFDLSRTERAAPETIGLSPSPSFYALRADQAHPGAYWIFTRNLTPESQFLTIQDGVSVETRPYEALMIPYRVPLKNGWMLNRLNVEPLAQTSHCLILPGNRSLVAEIQVPEPFMMPPEQQNAGVTIVHQDETAFQLRLTLPLSPEAVESVQMGDYTVYLLGAEQMDRLWALGDDQFVIGPDLVRSPEELFIGRSRPCCRIDSLGESYSLSLPSAPSIPMPALEAWQVTPGGKPLFDAAGYCPIVPQGSSMDANGIYEGAVWYRYEFTGAPQTLTIQAQHIWAVFVNGTCLTHHHTFYVHPDTPGPADIVTMLLPQGLLKPDETNVVHVFVESLGHHKGFFDDTREPRGVLLLKLDDREIQTEGLIQVASLVSEGDQGDEAIGAKASPIWHAATTFELSIPETKHIPMGLIVDLDVERVNIRLNGLLIGKYWRSCKNQTTFYLPEGVLNPTGLNHLELTLINFFPLSPIEKNIPKGYGRVSLQPYQEFSKLS